MKRFSIIVFSANACVFLITPCAVLANNCWMKGGCDKDGYCYYQKVISKSGPYVYYLEQTPIGTFKNIADCEQWRARPQAVNGKSLEIRWRKVMRGSLGEISLNNVCG